MEIIIKNKDMTWEFIYRYFPWSATKYLDMQESETEHCDIWKCQMDTTKKIKDKGTQFEIFNNEEKILTILISEEIPKAPPTTIYESYISNLTIESFANIGVQLCNINNQKLFWVTLDGKLFDYTKRQEAYIYQLNQLQQTLPHTENNI